jgi:hypothetical protein
MERVQLIRFTKALKPGDVWINPMAIVYAEVNEKKDDVAKKDEKDKNRPAKTYTVLHLMGNNDKAFVNEHPDEINAIIRRLVVEKESKQSTSYK